LKEWDTLRIQRVDALDKILESLDTQPVPPDFHKDDANSSLFGSQHSNEEGEERPRSPHLRTSLTDTLRIDRPNARPGTDRTKWKSLRDFVDEKAINEVLETIENNRSTLDVCNILPLAYQNYL
jgi:autophagy-related protein 17